MFLHLGGELLSGCPLESLVFEASIVAFIIGHLILIVFVFLDSPKCTYMTHLTAGLFSP